MLNSCYDQSGLSLTFFLLYLTANPFRLALSQTTLHGQNRRSGFSSNTVLRPVLLDCTPLYIIVCDCRTDYMCGRQLDLQQHQSALTLIDNLLTELKRLDDKMILTEVHLLESRVYRGIGNFPKAKASLYSISSVFSLMVIHLLGRSHILTNSRKLHLLPTCSPGFP